MKRKKPKAKSQSVTQIQSISQRFGRIRPVLTREKTAKSVSKSAVSTANAFFAATSSKALQILEKDASSFQRECEKIKVRPVKTR